MPMVSPFRAGVDLADHAGESQITFAASVPPARSLLRAEQIADAFVAAANLGMFSKQPTEPMQPILADSAEPEASGRLQYSWTVAGLQLSAYRVLLAMLTAAHQTADLLESVRLVSTSPGGRRLGLDELFSGTLSLKGAKSPFPVRTRRDLDNCREPVIRLHFQRAISDDALESLVPAFLAWDRIVIEGGFVEGSERTLPVSDINKVLASQQTYLAAPDTVEHLFYRFAGGQAAFDALINLGIRLHFVFSPLAALEIE